MKNKKWLLIGITAILCVGALLIFIPIYNKSKLIASCVHVASIHNPYYEDAMQGEGLVTNDQGQTVYVMEDQVIEEVYVEVGDQVNVGDPLMAFDISSLNASIEMQYLELDRYQKEAEALRQKLEALKQTTPQPQAHCISSLKGYRPEIIDEKKRYTIECFEDSYVMGEVFNELVLEGPATMVFQISGKTIWTIDSESLFSSYDPTMKIKITTREVDMTEQEMSKAEIQREIFATQQAIKANDIDYRKAQIALQSLQKSVEDGIVYASVSGIVRHVATAPTSYEPYLSIAGNEGLYLTGALSESMLSKVKVGDKIQATSWQTGMMYEAKITTIDTYPSSDQSRYNWNQPNETFYDFKAYIADAKDLNNGDYLSITIDPVQNNNASVLCIDKMYVRESKGSYYVMKDSHGKLKKQPVKVGKVVSGGYYIQIIEGLSENDYIAFPYGKSGAEGVKTMIE